MFQGEFDHSVDDKGRVIIPTRFRSSLGERFFMTKGYGPCVWIYDDVEWKAFTEHLNKQPSLDQHTIRLQRFFTSTETGVDSQGRLAIPSKLREYAKIKENSEVVIVGAGPRIEIWASDEWTRYNDTVTEEMITESAREVGIG